MQKFHEIKFGATLTTQENRGVCEAAEAEQTRFLLEGHIFIDGKPFAPGQPVSLFDLCSFFSRAKSPRFSFSTFAPLTCTCGVPECSNWCAIDWSQEEGVVSWTISAQELEYSNYRKVCGDFDRNEDGSLTLRFDQRRYMEAVRELQAQVEEYLAVRPCALLAEDFEVTTAEEWAKLVPRWNRRAEKLLTEHTAIRRFHDQHLRLGVGAYRGQSVELTYPVIALLYIRSERCTLAGIGAALESYDLTWLAEALVQAPDAVNYLNFEGVEGGGLGATEEELAALWEQWKCNPGVACIR